MLDKFINITINIVKILKKFVLKSRVVINFRNSLRSYKLAKNNKGQMTRDSVPGKLLYDFLTKHKIKCVLEIGTWNGLGSTKTIFEALDKINENFKFITIESDKTFHKRAKKNFRNCKDNIDLKLGRLIEIEELPKAESIDFTKHGLINENSEWLVQDIRRYKKINNIYKDLPAKFDFILFDGGEFSTFLEFKKLYRKTKYFGLDDINTFKQYEVLKYINKNSNKFTHISTAAGLSIYKNNI